MYLGTVAMSGGETSAFVLENGYNGSGSNIADVTFDLNVDIYSSV